MISTFTNAKTQNQHYHNVPFATLLNTFSTHLQQLINKKIWYCNVISTFRCSNVANPTKSDQIRPNPTKAIFYRQTFETCHLINSLISKLVVDFGFERFEIICNKLSMRAEEVYNILPFIFLKRNWIDYMLSLAKS
jgi:hypothetical protein